MLAMEMNELIVTFQCYLTKLPWILEHFPNIAIQHIETQVLRKEIEIVDQARPYINNCENAEIT